MKKIIIAQLIRSLLVLILFSTPHSGLHAQSTPYNDGGNQVKATVAASGQTRTSGTDIEVLAIGSAWVNVRSGPGTGFAVLKTLPRGTKGEKTGEANGWYLMDFGNGLKGWVRGDLVAADPTQVAGPGEKEKAALSKSFERWDRHLGKSMLDYSRIPTSWKLGKAYASFKTGDFKAAYLSAQSDAANPVQARYLMVKCLFQLGYYKEAQQSMNTIERYLEDRAYLQVMDGIAKPWIDEKVAFKFGGFDSLATYKKKDAQGARVGLESAEYYAKFVDINTWKWRSPQAYKEFDKIAGIDCSGFVQRLEMDAFQKAGVKYPIPGRVSTTGLSEKQVSKEIDPGYRPPPPPNIRPGDMILLDYGHNRYGHSMLYRGVDAAGNIRVIAMGDTARETILPPEKFQFYKGTYRMNGMDSVRKALTA